MQTPEMTIILKKYLEGWKSSEESYTCCCTIYIDLTNSKYERSRLGATASNREASLTVISLIT